MPEKIEAYQCKVCQGIFLGSYQEALQHEQISKDTKLPSGLVLRRVNDECSPYLLITDEGIFSYGKGIIDQDDFTHDYIHTVSKLDIFQFALREISHDQEISSRKIKRLIKNNEFRLLEEPEFKEFRNFYRHSRDYLTFLYGKMNPDQLKRSIPELEQLLTSASSV